MYSSPPAEIGDCAASHCCVSSLPHACTMAYRLSACRATIAITLCHRDLYYRHCLGQREHEVCVGLYRCP